MPRVLIIDDQPHVRAAISVALKANGYEVVAVESGRLGLIELNKTVFDITPVRSGDRRYLHARHGRRDFDQGDARTYAEIAHYRYLGRAASRYRADGA